MVFHSAVHIGIICHHVEIPRSGKPKQNGFRFACFLALQSFIDCHFNGMRAFRRWQNGFQLGELHARFEHFGLFYTYRAGIAIVHQLRNDRTHAVVAQATSVVGRRNEAIAERVHLTQRTRLTCVGKVVSIAATCHRWATGRLNANKIGIGLGAIKLVFHERTHKTTHIAAATSAANNNVGIFAKLFEGCFRFKTNNRLMQQHLIKHAPQLITATVFGHMERFFNSFRNCSAQRAGAIGVVCKHLTTNFGGVRRRRGNTCAKCLHDIAAERLLLIRALHHEHFAIKPVVRSSLGQSGTPLPCTRFGGNRA